MKEKSATKVVRVDDEIEVVVSERSSIDSSLEDNSSSNHEDAIYPLVIAGKHNDMFIDITDDEDDGVTFKPFVVTPKIKTEDTKPAVKRSFSGVLDSANCSSVNMYGNQQQGLNFEDVRHQLKEEEDCASPPKIFCSRDKDSKQISSKSKLKDHDNKSIAYLWPGGSQKVYPTYFLESESRLSSILFDKTKTVQVKEERTDSPDIKLALHETSASAFRLDCQSSVPSDLNESSRNFTDEKSTTLCQRSPTPEEYIPNNCGSPNSEVQGSEDMEVQVKTDIKTDNSSVDKGTALQVHKGRKREVDLLYDNLKEISWAQDKSFTNLLGDKKIQKRIERISNLKGNLTSGKRSISISIGKKIIKRVSAQQRNCPPKSKKEVKKIKKEIRSDHSRFFKGKLDEKQNVKWYKTGSKNLKNKNAEALVQSKKKFVKPKLADKGKPVTIKKQVAASEQPWPSNELKSAGKQNTSNASSSKKIQNVKIGKQEERKKKESLSKNGTSVIKKEGGEFLDFGGDISESLQKGPELRVTIEPLETHDLCSSDVFRRRNFGQSAFRVFSGMNQGNVESVLRGVNESIMIRNNVKTARKRKYEEESVRTSVRQSECAFRYKEIVVKRHANYMQVVLVPNALKQNCLSVEAMKELKEAFVSAKKDSNCKALLLNSSGSFFCSGVDLSQVLGQNKKQIAEEMALTVRELILTVAFFNKPVVAAVNGCAVGLGVTLLTLCDMVLASDKATFCIPAATLGYLPEGGIVLTLPQVVGATVAVEMLLQGRKLTAEQALKYGLVSEVLWPTQLMENVFPRMQSLVSQSAQIMSATKAMVRCYLWEKLPLQLEHEWHIISSQWQQATCQQNIKKILQTGWLND